jgi:hypothetical protein
MKPLGFSLAEMHEAMGVIDDIAIASPGAGAADRLALLLDQARERRESLQHQVEMADEFITLLAAYAKR